MSVTQVEFEGREQLMRELKDLGSEKTRAIMRKAVAIAMRPVLGLAKEEVPIDSGRLAASLGQMAKDSSKGGFVASRVGVRRDFTYTNSSGQKMTTHRGDKQKKAIEHGATKDRVTAQQYAGGIMFGTDRSGRVRRKAGGVDFLNDAILSDEETIISTVEAEMRKRIEAAKQS